MAARALAVISLTIALVAPRVRSQTRDGAAPAPPAAPARVTGRVVAATGTRGAPIRRAIVTLVGGALAAGRSSITDDEGRFDFEDVPAGQFSLSARRPGFLPAAYGATRPGRPGTPIHLGAGESLTDLTVLMTHGAAIDGVIRDPNGDPAGGVEVSASRVQSSASGDRVTTSASVLTDDRGEDRFFDLAPGDYVVSTSMPSMFSFSGIVGLSESDTDAALAALQSRAGRGGGVAPGSAPAPAPVERPYSFAPTFFPGVGSPGDATRVTVAADEDREQIDFAIQLIQRATIDGTIVSPTNGPVPPLQLRLFSGGSSLQVQDLHVGGPQISMLPADRTFHIGAVPPGHYTLAARTFGGAGSTGAIVASSAAPITDLSAPVLWATTDVDVSGGDLPGVTLTLHPALHLSGRLAFDSSGTPPADAMSIGVTLTPVASDDVSANALSASIPGRVRADGTFEFVTLLPGVYHFAVSAPPAWWLRSAVVDGTDTLDGPLIVRTSDITGVTLTLSDRHTALSGTLTGTGGAPAPDFFIVAFSTDRATWRPPSRRVLSTRPGTDGRFELGDLPPGSYYLAALTDVEPSDLEDASFLDSLIPNAVTVAIGEGERRVQNLRLGGG